MRLYLKIGTHPPGYHEAWKWFGSRRLRKAPEVGDSFDIRENGKWAKASQLYVHEIKLICGEPLYFCERM